MARMMGVVVQKILESQDDGICSPKTSGGSQNKQFCVRWTWWKTSSCISQMSEKSGSAKNKDQAPVMSTLLSKSSLAGHSSLIMFHKKESCAGSHFYDLVWFFQVVELRSIWRDCPCVVLFLRRLGCQVCRWIAKETSKLREVLESNGVRLIGVAPESLGLQEFLEGNYFAGGRSWIVGAP